MSADWQGEAMDIEDESMDCVVVTHVLCSVQVRSRFFVTRS